jgi:hypothetical protein
MFEIEPSQRSNSYAFARKPSMESDLSQFHCEASPLFECFRAQKIVNMLLFKLSVVVLINFRFYNFKGLSTNMLNFVFSQVETLGNGLVGSKLAS